MPNGPNTDLYVSLRDHFDARLAELDRRLTDTILDRDARVLIAMTAAKEAVDKAERAGTMAAGAEREATEKRLALLNEFRAQQADEARKYAERTVVAQQVSAIEERLSRNENGLTSLLATNQQFGDMEKRLARQESLVASLQGRALALAGFGALIGGTVVGLLIRLIGV